MSTEAIVLLSGGLDSSTCLAIAQQMGYRPRALSFFYGQRNTFELQSAKKLAVHYGVSEHLVLELPLAHIGGSSLTTEREVEMDRSFEQIGVGIPSTYVPARNTLFLSFALAFADARDICDIFIGVNAVDTSGYPDCRPDFILAFETVANLGTRIGSSNEKKISIHTPLQQLSKAEIISRGLKLGVPYELTSTCYQPDSEGRSCGRCDACRLRLQGFREAGAEDPLQYQR